ncbi:MAG: hypothetical protein KA771_09135 [Spirochaetales bacterium]|nr:hypothetical protein [Spirochaetales bacterium]
MKITLDGETIDYTLEKETNLFQVLFSLSELLRNQRAEITGVVLNGEPFSFWDRSGAENIPIDTVRELSITSQTAVEREFEELRILLQFFYLLNEAVQKKQRDAVTEILTEYPHVQPTLEQHLRTLFPAEGSSQFPLKDPAGGTEEEWATAENFTQQVITLLKGRIREITSPQEECEGLLQLLELSKKDLESTSVLLQTGQDTEAMKKVLSFIEIISKTLRMLGRLHPAESRSEELYRSLAVPLQDLLQAFLHKDSVLMGDLLEYEIAPRIGDIQNLLKEALSEIKP